MDYDPLNQSFHFEGNVSREHAAELHVWQFPPVYKGVGIKIQLVDRRELADGRVYVRGIMSVKGCTLEIATQIPVLSELSYFRETNGVREHVDGPWPLV